MNKQRLCAAVVAVTLGSSAGATTWTSLGGNSQGVLELNSGLGFGVGLGTLGLESGLSISPGQIGLLTSASQDSVTYLLNNRMALDGAEVRLGLVWRDIPIPTGDLGFALNGYVGAGAAYAFNKIYDVIDDIQNGKINVPPEEAVNYAYQPLFSDLNPYAEAGLTGKLAGPVGWRAGVRYSNSISFNLSLDLAF